MPNNEDLLKELKDRFDYCVQSWEDIRQAKKEDFKYISGDPWPADERARREIKGQERPCIATDELNQYLNQLVNDVRQNKRTGKMVPKGDGANDATAEARSALIRQVEYQSNAQSAYATAFESATGGGYGFVKICKRYVDEMSMEQELYIQRVPNADAIYIDPDYKEADASDINYAFEIDWVSHKKFKKDWPKASVTDFSSELITENPNWVQADRVQIASYWRREMLPRTLMVIDGKQHGVMKLLLENLKGELDKEEMTFTSDTGEVWKVLKFRKTEIPKVTQYITNGVEILEKNPCDGSFIPIGSCFGKELWVDKGGGAKKELVSLVRLARQPYMAYCYARTAQLEVVGSAPKSKKVFFAEQVANHSDEWQVANRSPKPYLIVDPAHDPVTGQLLPFLPDLVYDSAALAGIEIFAEAMRRAIQAAMGIAGLPTAAQRTNQKSGVALDKIEAQESQGSFHFIDNYDRFLAHVWRMMDDLIDPTYDTARDVGARDKAEDYRVMRINDPDAKNQKTGEAEHFPMNQGDHGVTITTGSAQDSERTEVNDFVNILVQAQGLVSTALAQPQSTSAKILALFVKLKNMGPLGDRIAEVISPDPQGPQAVAQQQAQQLQQQAQQLQIAQTALQQMSKELAEAKTGLLKTTMEIQSKERMKALDVQKDIVDSLINAKVDNYQGELERAHTMLLQLVGQAHEAGLQAADQAHQQSLADQQNQQADQDRQAQQQQSEQQLAAQQQQKVEAAKAS